MKPKAVARRRYVAFSELPLSPLLVCAEGSGFRHLLNEELSSVQCGSTPRLRVTVLK